MSKSILVTGGAGFIGSALIHLLLKTTDWRVINLDALTYSGNINSLSDIATHPHYKFVQVDICQRMELRQVFEHFQPDFILHLAAESHVDRSIEDSSIFLQTNIIGTFNLLEESRNYCQILAKTNSEKAKNFRFQHISTDEVFGDLDLEARPFQEDTAYAPSSPYSASKAASDHLVRAWQRTYGLPTLITNCSNNYGPRQFPEKLIPLIIIRALAGESLPVYGDGGQIRDWLYVEDHARALIQVLTKGKVGETYLIGGNNEQKNIDIVNKLCELLDARLDNKPNNLNSFKELITFVRDRPGHDRRYAINSSKIQKDLGWKPLESFDSGLAKTVEWYLKNQRWWQDILDNNYQCQRLG